MKLEIKTEDTANTVINMNAETKAEYQFLLEYKRLIQKEMIEQLDNQIATFKEFVR